MHIKGVCEQVHQEMDWTLCSDMKPEGHKSTIRHYVQTEYGGKSEK